MIALLIGVLVMGQQTAGYFKQVVKTPTGKNGYEELVYAGDVLLANRFGTYEYLILMPPTKEPGATKSTLPPQTLPETEAIWRELEGKNLLQQYRIVVAKNRQVVDLVEQAARKDIYDPRTDVDFNTTLPELAQFKSVAKFLVYDAYVKFADGLNTQAINTLATAFDVYDRTGRGVIIQFLVGVACQSILLGTLQSHLPRLSHKDAVRLEQLSKDVLGREPGIRQSIGVELKFMTSGLAKTLADPKQFESIIGFAPEDQRDRALKTFASLGSGDRQRVANGVESRIREEAKKISDAFAGDEAAWVSFDPEPSATPDWSSANGLIDAIVTTTLPAYRQIGRSAAINRTQIRLIGLVGSVLRYRWEHNALPAKLEDVVGKERAFDPLSKLPFEMTRDAAGNFAITSKGTKETGEIALRYRRTDSGSAPLPPSL